MAPRLSVAELVDLGDLDELLRRVDDLCDRRDWAGLLDLRDRCRAAFERGRQLWPAASNAEYRLALEAPGRWAGAVVAPGGVRFSLGPLSEVAASTHTWDELAPHLPPSPEAGLVAQERVVRGEDLRDDARVRAQFVELPLVLQPWEPAYPLATYREYAAEFDDVPGPSRWDTAEVPPAGALMDDHESVHALVELAGAWTRQSDGRASAAAVSGDALAAIGALGVPGPVRIAPVPPADAVGAMAWAAASGGAHGRRRGMAQGRFAAWWAVAALGGALDRWPDIEPVLARLRWYRWEPDDGGPATGWSLRLAAERPDDGRAWALEATDHS